MWYFYYKDRKLPNWKNDYFLDSARFRYIHKSFDPAGIKLKKVYGDSAISWQDFPNKRLVIKKLGTCKERWNANTKSYEFCGADSFTFDPMQDYCIKCNDLSYQDKLQKKILLDCGWFTADDKSLKPLVAAEKPDHIKEAWKAVFAEQERLEAERQAAEEQAKKEKEEEEARN